jgi:hypothetical protein
MHQKVVQSVLDLNSTFCLSCMDLALSGDLLAIVHFLKDGMGFQK